MSNLNGIPSADYFETKLANTWNWTVGTVYVEDVPSASMPISEYSYIVVNPWESNMQVAKIDWWDIDNKTFNVIDVVVDSGAWTQYTAKTHPLGALVRFSNNYAFWKDIQTAINSKLDNDVLAPVATSGDYDDLINTPTLAAVATSGDYDDLSNKPTPISIAVWDKVLQLSWSNELSATVTASYDSWTKKITLYGANSAVISEIDCTAFIKDGMIQDVKIVTDPAWYAPWKYLEFDFNTDSGVSDIYIALSDLAVYTAWEWINISSNAISVVAATASTLWWIKVWSWLTITSGTLSADSQTDENYTTAEKTKLSWIETAAQVNKIEKVQVNWTDLPISSKTVNVKLKTINGTAVAGEWDIDIMARHYTAWTWISIDGNDEVSISTAYQNTIAAKANSADLATVATSGSYNDLLNKPTIPANTSDLNNDSWFITSADLSWYQTTANMVTNLTSPDNDHYPTAKAVADAISGAGAWDVVWPNSSTDWNIALFDGATWKIIKDSGVNLSNKQDTLTAWNWIDITSNKISTTFIYWESSTAAATVQKEVSIPSITELNVWQVIIVKPTVTSTVASSTLKLNSFPAYKMLYNGTEITTSTDSVVWTANVPSMFYLDEVSGTKYWRFLWHWLDSNSTYTLNQLIDAWRYKAWTGTYAISRYSLCMMKADGTWEKITATNAAYSTWTSKTVNTNWFVLNQIKYYNTTSSVAGGAFVATNTLTSQAATVTLAYSLNCGTAPWWSVWDPIYIVWTIWADWLFYLDTTARWSTTLPNTKDWKLYIRIWTALAADNSTASFLQDRPIFYYDNWIKEYTSSKQDKLTAWTWINISSNTISNTWVTSVNWNTWAVTVAEFEPDNAWSTDQVLTKTADWYEWANATGGWTVMDEADYQDLPSPQNDFLYFTFE